ncbi:MAG: glycosyltransferase [Streptococcaceae bacterium]|jgi:glycosyltransferase involved in cell wall biosynthesis|nr:glycosyltransferase [Streptococcaceae bacterium]
MKEETLSIVIPIYNAEHFLPECLVTLSERKEGDELILINDGSTDRSKEICEEFANKNKNVHFIDQPNLGVSESRNNGIKQVKSKWVMFVDADDTLTKGWRKEIENALASFSKSDVIIFSKQIESQEYDAISCLRTTFGDRSIPELRGGYLNSPWSKIYSKKIINDNEIEFDRKLIIGEDLLFNCHVYSKSRRIIGINHSIYRINKNIGSTINRFDSKIIENELVFHEEFKKFLKNNHFNQDFWEILFEENLLRGLFSVVNKIALTHEKDRVELVRKLLIRPEYRVALGKFPAYKKQFSRIAQVLLGLLYHENVEAALFCAKLFYFIKKLHYKSGITEEI